VASYSSGKSRAESVASELEAEILQQRQDLPVGARLGLRADLISRFNVSPGVVNEALRLLRERGLVTVKPGPSGGVFVADVPPGVRLSALDLWFQRMSIPPLEVFESRVLLDSLFYEIALERATREDIRRMEQAVHAMEDATEDPRRFFEAIIEFHLSIARASHASILVGLYETLATILLGSLVRAEFREGPEVMNVSIETHAAILDALRAKDRGRLKQAIANHQGGLISPLEPTRSPVTDRPQPADC
jgi:DNA-binding FadR family transcriptional regulator